MTELNTMDIHNAIHKHKSTAYRMIDGLNYGYPPKYRIFKRIKHEQDLMYWLGIKEGLDKAGNSMVELALKQEQEIELAYKQEQENE